MNWKLCLCITTESTPMTGMGSHSVLKQDAAHAHFINSPRTPPERVN
jgi:hypothetical protein